MIFVIIIFVVNFCLCMERDTSYGCSMTISDAFGPAESQKDTDAGGSLLTADLEPPLLELTPAAMLPSSKDITLIPKDDEQGDESKEPTTPPTTLRFQSPPQSQKPQLHRANGFSIKNPRTVNNDLRNALESAFNSPAARDLPTASILP